MVLRLATAYGAAEERALCLSAAFKSVTKGLVRKNLRLSRSSPPNAVASVILSVRSGTDGGTLMADIDAGTADSDAAGVTRTGLFRWSSVF
jgi:hypothetical protein